MAHKMRRGPNDCQFSDSPSQTGVQVFQAQNVQIHRHFETKTLTCVGENYNECFPVYLCEFLGVGQVVNSDGQEDVEQRICGGVKEMPTGSGGVSGGRNEEMEGGDGETWEHKRTRVFFHEATAYYTPAGYSCQKV